MLKRIYSFFDFKTIGAYIGVAILLTLVMETIARHSFTSLFTFLTHGTASFFYNAVIVVLTLFAVRFFGKRTFALTLASMVWLTLVTISAVLQTMRPNPLTAIDFRIFLSAYGIMDSYVKVWQLVLIIVAILAFVGLMTLLFIKSKKQSVNFKRESCGLSFLVCVFLIFTAVGHTTGILAIDFENVAQAYDDHGFAYCFCSTIFKKGIPKPDSYGSKLINRMVSKLPAVTEPDSNEELPNIVVVQLESFFDINYYNEYRTSENPIPNFTLLKSEYPSGILKVPVFGGGTANTEFEVLTGMNVENFGGGEVPYNSVLEKKTCESLAYNLARYGYTPTAIHDHIATFYDRNKVYANLGFERFIPVEYMTNVERTPIGWAKDSVLTQNIFDAMDSTSGQDFVFTVSVQGHGGYPTEDESFDLPISLDNDDGSDRAFSIRYFANQLHEMDEFVGELVKRVTDFDEKTIVVFYGDHLPALNFTDSSLDFIDTYETEYVIYSNFDYAFLPTELEAYQLGCEIMRPLSLNCGFMTRLNQMRSSLTDYDAEQRNLQYDMLYGENYSGGDCHPKTQLSLGVKDIVITEVVYDGFRLRVNCENSTYYSKIFINDKEIYTKYEAENVLISDDVEALEKGDEITVCQVSDNGTVLGKTEAYEVE